MSYYFISFRNWKQNLKLVCNTRRVFCFWILDAPQILIADGYLAKVIFNLFFATNYILNLYVHTGNFSECYKLYKSSIYRPLIGLLGKNGPLLSEGI
jgi:hypothetical protein